MSTVRTLLVHALQNERNVRQLDIPTALLNGREVESVYIKTPQGLNMSKNNVLKLNRTLYGIKESPRCWNNKCNETIMQFEFKWSQYDFCLHVKDTVWLLVYVDDILLTGEEQDVKETIQYLKDQFRADIGEIIIFDIKPKSIPSIKIKFKKEIKKRIITNQSCIFRNIIN